MLSDIIKQSFGFFPILIKYFKYIIFNNKYILNILYDNYNIIIWIILFLIILVIYLLVNAIISDIEDLRPMVLDCVTNIFSYGRDITRINKKITKFKNLKTYLELLQTNTENIKKIDEDITNLKEIYYQALKKYFF